MRTIHTDILIIGSGAAGGVLAATLTESLPGKRVLIVEKGGYYGAEFFNQHEWDMRVLYADKGLRSTADGAIPVRGGECVGGGTTVNVAFSLDPLPEVWSRWRGDEGLENFSFAADGSDYGVAGLTMTAQLAEVKRRINVHPAADDDLNDNNRLFEESCKALGLSSKRMPLNMRDCIRCGYCAEGCAYDRKQGTAITFIPDALSRGAQLIHHFDARSLLFEKRRGALTAVGAVGTVRETEPGSRPNAIASGALRIRAGLVIVAAGAIASPLLLQRSEHPDPHRRIGRGLVLHPSLPVIGVLDHDITNYRGISGSVYSDHWAQSHGFFLECLFGHPVYGGNVLPSIGREHFDLFKKYRRLGAFGVMLVDSVDPLNRVEMTPTGTRIHYKLGESDKERLRFAAGRAVELMFATGAEEVILPSDEEIGPMRAPRFKRAADAALTRHLQFIPHRTTVTSAHCQATTKMSEDPRRGTINSRCESHLVKNLMVCDSSSFPTSCGINPMISIMTLARYQGRRIAAEWSRYAG
jgi:choline dehydrogenase-like flavoprotein